MGAGAGLGAWAGAASRRGAECEAGRPGAPAALRAVLERAVADLAPRAAGDSRLQREVLRLCVQHADLVDSAGPLFEALEERSIGLREALFYEAYALHLEKCRSHAEAEAVYELGIQRAAQPLQRLEGAFQGFQGRMVKRRERDARRARKENRARATSGVGEKPIAGKGTTGGESGMRAARQPLKETRTPNRPAESVCSGAAGPQETQPESVQKPSAAPFQQSDFKKAPAPAVHPSYNPAEKMSARDSTCSPFASVARSGAATPSGEFPSRSLEILGTPLGKRLEGDEAISDIDGGRATTQTGGTMWTSDAMFDSFVFAGERGPPGAQAEGRRGQEEVREPCGSLLVSSEAPAPARLSDTYSASVRARPSPGTSLDGSFMSNQEVTLHTEKAFECIDAMFEKTLNLENLPGERAKKSAPGVGPGSLPQASSQPSGGELLVYEDPIHSTTDLLL